jgi:hypothetical protein
MAVASLEVRTFRNSDKTLPPPRPAKRALTQQARFPALRVRKRALPSEGDFASAPCKLRLSIIPIMNSASGSMLQGLIFAFFFDGMLRSCGWRDRLTRPNLKMRLWNNSLRNRLLTQRSNPRSSLAWKSPCPTGCRGFWSSSSLPVHSVARWQRTTSVQHRCQVATDHLGAASLPGGNGPLGCSIVASWQRTTRLQHRCQVATDHSVAASLPGGNRPLGCSIVAHQTRYALISLPPGN